MNLSLKDKVAIVTGGAGGIGSATCRLLAERGARVVVADIAYDHAQALAGDLEGALAVELDLANEASVVSMFETVMRRFGRLDVLDNNAALLSEEIARQDGDVAAMAADVWDRVFAVNTRGTMLSCREALKIMETQGRGVIINTASNLALQGNLVQAAYSASKAAVLQLTRSIATSHGKRGIRCNSVLPGLTASKSALEHLPSRLREIVEEETLTPFLGEPADIAHVVAFLASDEARYVTGQMFVVDGGTSAHIPGFARLSEMAAGR
jgi:NAD(P)-dependent dehydrogenase (short-subunit alcohol dehydrogenase family)